MNLFSNFKQISLIILLLASQDATSGIVNFIDSLSSAVEEKLSEKGIKPYIIPLHQGRLIDNEEFQKIDVGLSKEQVIYLLGKPPLESPFLENQWNYIYFNNTDVKKQKSVSIHFNYLIWLIPKCNVCEESLILLIMGKFLEKLVILF